MYITGDAIGNTFQQRYCLYENYFISHDKNAPILFYTGNESPVDEYINQTGLMWNLGLKLNALIIFAEHRYFGKSIPKLKGLRNCLAFCTSQQALADHAMLAINIRTIYASLNNKNRPIIAFGGS